MKHGSLEPDNDDRMNPFPIPLKKTRPKPLHFQKRSQTETGNELWLVTLSDLLMLLMIFFVVLFGMALQREKRDRQPLQAGILIPSIFDRGSVVPNPSSKNENTSASLETELMAALNHERGEQNVKVERIADRVVLTFPERIIFDPGQAQLKLSSQTTLDKVAAFILERPYLIVEVQGHTDDIPINSTRYPSNWELSVDRAMQVSRTLILLGIKPTRLSVKGFGEYRPNVPNNSDANRLINRRVEIQFSVSPDL